MSNSVTPVNSNHAQSGLGTRFFEDEQNVAGFDLVADFDTYLGHHALGGCVHMLFHLHCFENDQRVAFGHVVTGLHSNIEHRARHRSYEAAGWAARGWGHETRDKIERLGAIRGLDVKQIVELRNCRGGPHTIDFDVDSVSVQR